ncbi:MAG: GFA family protein [Alphaproteobacteria bacterium]
MSKSNEKRATGGCHCGAVRYEVRGVMRGIVNCHCAMCRRLHGTFGAHAKAKKQDITMINEDGLSWYESSATARRGFCRECGSSLFWQANTQDTTGIVAGTLDEPTGLATIGHIFVAQKGDCYEICDDLPKFDTSSQGKLPGDFL